MTANSDHVPYAYASATGNPYASAYAVSVSRLIGIRCRGWAPNTPALVREILDIPWDHHALHNPADIPPEDHDELDVAGIWMNVPRKQMGQLTGVLVLHEGVDVTQHGDVAVYDDDSLLVCLVMNTEMNNEWDVYRVNKDGIMEFFQNTYDQTKQEAST